MFIGRKNDGTIYGAWASRQPDDADHPGMEEVPDNHPDVVAFFAPKQTVATTEAAVQKYLDDAAKAKGYDGILSACSYAASANLKFGAEGRAFVVWRDAVWAYCYQAMNDVQAARRSVPTIDQLIAELPALVI